MTADYLDSLGEAVFSALGVCQVGLVGEAAALAGRLAASGMTCPADGPRDAWVIVATLEELVRGEVIPACEGARLTFVVCRDDAADAAVPLRARVEAAMIGHGYIKHPATTELFGYARLDDSNAESWALFEYRSLVFADGDTPDRLKRERDLHSDMLREAGVRSDAHLVRYQLAASLVRPGDTVLDAACGLGYGSHVLATLCPASRITGIDLSDWAVDFARRNYSSYCVDYRCGSLPEALNEMANASVDFVVSLETLEHVSDPQALLAAFFRVLKPGGRIFVSVPNDWADETGEDPNPHHLHVYDWARVRDELAAHFIVESAWSLTASGCKTGGDLVWRPQPRKLDVVALDAAATTEGEWWLVCASKSPLADAQRPYEESIHAGFEGATHLVDFAEHYDRPWLVHTLVELPWRIRDKGALLALAQDVVASGRQGSADLGAGLTVTGWRILEDSGATGAAAVGWLDQVKAYVNTGHDDANPHVRRWCVSLNYLRARFFEARGDVAGADTNYRAVVDADVLHITPTLGTKQADAALRVGLLAFREGRAEEAVARWQAGLDAAFRCLQADSLEFVGNRQKPFIFAMNDLVEIADGATRLSNAILAVTSRQPGERTAVARQLGGVTQRSLRSALSEMQARVVKLVDDLERHAKALATAQDLARERGARIGTLQAGLEVAQRLAATRADEITALSGRLDLTQVALEDVQRLAATRVNEIAA
ncbi:class I SAM-dependent methyltransferase, partial [Limnohabitans sp.]|uniref:class I SAM-dependent methyltransferase n=1 Tax=Limnohabitans sp. TaxID=1907725 RepID=UPI0037C08BBA